MSDIRVTTTRGSREPGTPTGIQINTFGMSKLAAGVTGEALRDIMIQAAQPMKEAAIEEWYQHWFRRQTGASQESIEIVTTELGERHARIQLQAGGERLIEDPRNADHTDYAPFLEFHEGGGMFRHAVFENQEEFVKAVHEGVRDLVRRLTE